jgi:type IV secretory pathway VirB2 component (pilin)
MYTLLVHLHIFALHFQGNNVPGQGLPSGATPHHLLAALVFNFLPPAGSTPFDGFLNSLTNFVTGPLGKALTLIGIVLCGAGYMYGKQSDNSSIGRIAIGAAIIILAANIYSWIAGS